MSVVRVSTHSESKSNIPFPFLIYRAIWFWGSCTQYRIFGDLAGCGVESFHGGPPSRDDLQSLNQQPQPQIRPQSNHQHLSICPRHRQNGSHRPLPQIDNRRRHCDDRHTFHLDSRFARRASTKDGLSLYVASVQEAEPQRERRVE